MKVRRRPRLRAVPPRRPRPPRRIPFFLACFVIVGGLITAIVAAQAVVSQTSFRMEDLSKRAERLEAEHGELLLRVAILSNFGRIEDEALAMGMRRREDFTVIEVPGLNGTDPP